MNQKPTIEMVIEFHRIFKLYTSHSPTIPPLEVRKLRARLLVEEVGEYLEASGFCRPAICDLIKELQGRIAATGLPQIGESQVDVVEAADALADIDYVCAGANLAWGFPAYDIINHVHESNMSKLGAEGEPVRDSGGKIIKGPNYWAPKIKPILLKYASGDMVHTLINDWPQREMPVAVSETGNTGDLEKT